MVAHAENRFKQTGSGNPYYVFLMKTKVCSNLQETFTLSFCIAIDLLHDVNHLKIGWEFYWQRHQFQSMYLKIIIKHEAR